MAKKKEQITEEMEKAKQDMADASIIRINMINKMVRETFRAIHGTISSTEMMAIGMDTVMAGLSLMSKSNDMDLLDVDGRIATMKAIQATINGIMEKLYLNPEVVAGMVGKAAMETASRDGLAKKISKKAE